MRRLLRRPTWTYVLGAFALVAVAGLALAACGGSDVIDPSPPEAADPDVVALSCDSGTAELSVSTVRASADGVHVVSSSGSDTGLTVNVTDQSGMSQLEGFLVGEREQVWSYRPGELSIQCVDENGNEIAGGVAATLLVSDPDGVWQDNACRAVGGQAREPAPEELGPDPLELAIEYASDVRVLREGDVVQPAGYLESAHRRDFRVVRSGRVVALVGVIELPPHGLAEGVPAQAQWFADAIEECDGPALGVSDRTMEPLTTVPEPIDDAPSEPPPTRSRADGPRSEQSQPPSLARGANLVVSLSELPSGFVVDAARSTSIDEAIEDGEIATEELALLRTTWVGGYRVDFSGPDRQALRCTISFSTTADAAASRYEYALERLNEKAPAGPSEESIASVDVNIGTRADASVYETPAGLEAFVVTWHYENTLSTCLGTGELDREIVVDAAMAQQQRIASPEFG